VRPEKPRDPGDKPTGLGTWDAGMEEAGSVHHGAGRDDNTPSQGMGEMPTPGVQMSLESGEQLGKSKSEEATRGPNGVHPKSYLLKKTLS